jgi:lysophospholipase L1-like esterase
MKVRMARGIAVFLVVAGLAATWRVRQLREERSGLSEVITEPWEALDGAPWLRPNLDQARVVLPDRPHRMAETQAHREGRGQKVHRTRSYLLDTNSQRLRGPEIGEKRGLRVIALGDSVTHGWGVATAEAWPAVLERRLREEGLEAQVINAGVPANPLGVMARWCETQAPGLEPDLVIWCRRSNLVGPQPTEEYLRAIRRCQAAVDAPLLAVLPPISSFDLFARSRRGALTIWESEGQSLSAALAPLGIPVRELTPAFREGQVGRGEFLEIEGETLKLVDRDSGESWLTTTLQRGPRGGELPEAVYALFESEPSLREALFFDEGHPDAEGFEVFASAILDDALTLLRDADESDPPAPPPEAGDPPH